jgi:hypothetical protein
VASLDVPFVPLTPTVGVGYERTELKVENLKGEYCNWRVEGGLNFTFLPLTYLYLGMGFSGSRQFYNVALGVKFGGLI